MQTPSRRSFLAAVAGATTATAGCSSLPFLEPSHEQWSVQVGSITDQFGFTDEHIVLGSTLGSLLFITRETGEYSPTFDIGDDLVVGPMLTGESVLACGHTEIYRVHPEQGTEWETKIENRTIELAHLFNGRLYVGTDAPLLEAFDVETGDSLWTTEGAAYLNTHSITDDGESLFVTAGSSLRKLDPETGAELWRMEVPIDSVANAAADIVFVGSRQYAFAFDPTTGDQLWNVKTGYKQSGRPIIGEKVFFGEKTGNANVRALEPATGETAWVHQTESDSILEVATVNGRVYATTHRENRLVALDNAGEERWSADFGQPPTELAVEGKEVYVADYKLRKFVDSL